ncbi:MAG TPA: M23 family metallopeptidase [Xanthobacteraceae bacterium]|nr:M23 family metallopeptidase [Xanthobacteraceae bacterium]
MDHARGRAHHRSRQDHETIDLGNEPPLSVDGGTGDPIDRRRVSAQWLSGTILTGLSGAALMGGAVFASLDGETNFATLPDRIENIVRGSISGGDKLAGTRKSDRLPPAGESNGARQVIRVTTMNRVGDREVVRVRPYVRVAANLTMSTSELTTGIPPFNAQKLLAAAGADGVPLEEQPGAEPDAEVTFVTRDLAGLLARAKIAATLPADDIIARVRDTANWTGGAQQARYQVAGVQPITASPTLAYAPADREADPYAGFETRIVPENITLLPKTGSQVTGGNSWNERTVTVKKGDSIATILRELGTTADEIKAIAAALGTRGRDGGLKEGQRLRILVASVPGSQSLRPVRVIVTGESAIEAVVALSDRGRYVPVDVTSMNTEVADAADDDEEDDGKGMRLYHSLYETALRNQIPRPVIESLIRIYSYDVDFQTKAAPGDSFDVLYAGEDEAGPDAKTDVMFASLTNGGETKKFYRFQTPDDGIVDYYDETGKSAKKFLVRKPLSQGIMRSGFGSRRHPLLHYTRMHTGVDWAAPLGTPIYASGNGVIDKVGWESGYGKYVRIRHSNGYETAYGHMTAFARSTQPGARVRQGQVIGYVGSTGLSTGPHLHYEILVNGRFVDPLRLKLPRGRVLDGPLLVNFEQERDRLDNMIARNSRVASTGQAAR